MAKANRLYQQSDYKRSVDKQDKDQEFRSSFRKDYARLLHSSSFRRLQGKTQLFPGIESDFFRNRLTHSLEVAQIAKSIAIKLNQSDKYLKDNKCQIDYDLIEFAALAHDLGHPPFGHVGEDALDYNTRNFGGYEGNAQTLRIVSRLEKKEFRNDETVFSYKGKIDNRVGLNLTHRSLASIIKYDKIIEENREERNHAEKGYYYLDKSLVEEIKTNVIGSGVTVTSFKTIEACIMDVADDIAYSTYDLEDCFKAGFLNMLDVFSLSVDSAILDNFIERVNRNMTKEGHPGNYSVNDIKEIIKRLFSFDDESYLETAKETPYFDEKNPYTSFLILSYKNFSKIGFDSHLRTKLTSSLVHRFINGTKVIPHESGVLPLTKVVLNKETREEVEVLKNFVYISQIESTRLRVPEFRGKEIIDTIFKCLLGGNGYTLMPDDFVQMYAKINVEEPEGNYKKRLIADFIAGMSDRYAIEFYARLKSENPQSIFKPL